MTIFPNTIYREIVNYIGCNHRDKQQQQNLALVNREFLKMVSSIYSVNIYSSYNDLEKNLTPYLNKSHQTNHITLMDVFYSPEDIRLNYFTNSQSEFQYDDVSLSYRLVTTYQNNNNNNNNNNYYNDDENNSITNHSTTFTTLYNKFKPLYGSLNQIHLSLGCKMNEWGVHYLLASVLEGSPGLKLIKLKIYNKCNYNVLKEMLQSIVNYRNNINQRVKVVVTQMGELSHQTINTLFNSLPTIGSVLNDLEIFISTLKDLDIMVEAGKSKESFKGLESFKLHVLNQIINSQSHSSIDKFFGHMEFSFTNLKELSIEYEFDHTNPNSSNQLINYIESNKKLKSVEIVCQSDDIINKILSSQNHNVKSLEFQISDRCHGPFDITNSIDTLLLGMNIYQDTYYGLPVWATKNQEFITPNSTIKHLQFEKVSSFITTIPKFIMQSNTIKSIIGIHYNEQVALAISKNQSLEIVIFEFDKSDLIPQYNNNNNFNNRNNRNNRNNNNNSNNNYNEDFKKLTIAIQTVGRCNTLKEISYSETNYLSLLSNPDLVVENQTKITIDNGTTFILKKDTRYAHKWIKSNE